VNIILIGIGGALGAILRHIVNDLTSKFLPFQIPLGILSVNIFGCFLIGLLMSSFITSKDNNYYFFIVGFLGSFTTMSAFTYQSIELFNNNPLYGSSYIITTLVLSIFATYIGLNISR
jgi:CrcB protein